ncbi:flagellar hook capping protein [Arthrobacter sp. I2-34]|uniref:Flagellar hook capping protein n=1 Tax=Arthrobacter hankyongi TaxID=2904801 RepID=A0ABS9L590_9MICC|nr:flagellar hook capping FlgD N-terminal domain-containing protein [Arthrobacter hankyongi]MCG2621637.1 flagellar hook capping protein [Arthrobacter hankyongi]
MPVEGVVSTTPAAVSTGVYAGAAARTPKQAMDSEVFMSLLVTQLRNQDPSSPMDTNQMISQTTQLAMMEQMTDLTKTNQENFSLQMRSAAAALLGQTASYADTQGKAVTGVISAVSYAGAVPTVTIGGVEVPLDALSGVSAAATS